MQPRENSDNLPVEAAPAWTMPAMHGCVLVAEHDDVQADLLRVALTQAGYEVRTVQSGQAALDALDAGPPDLILMDAALPAVDGYEATRRLKASDEARFIPVVILTDRSSAEDEARCLEVGADDFLTRPFNPTEVLIRVRSLLRLGRLHQDLADNNQELQAAYETARESEAKYRALIHDAQDALFLIDPKTATILEANRRARDLCGYDDDDLIGQSAALLSPDAGWLDLIARVVAEGRISVEEGGIAAVQGRRGHPGGDPALPRQPPPRRAADPGPAA